jgi:hypothetical protein
MSNDVQTIEGISPDVSAFCTLLARIVQRCLAEKDECILTLLALQIPVIAQEEEVTYESAA